MFFVAARLGFCAHLLRMPYDGSTFGPGSLLMAALLVKLMQPIIWPEM